MGLTIFGRVKGTGAESPQTNKVSVYWIAACHFFQPDGCDTVGLLCIAQSLEGDESDTASSRSLWNALQREISDVLEILTHPIWCFVRKGQTSQGQKPYARQRVLYREPGAVARV